MLQIRVAAPAGQIGTPGKPSPPPAGNAIVPGLPMKVQYSIRAGNLVGRLEAELEAGNG